eukprot:scaffold35003_cov91-Phaeocystis_antarctica.AAC.3
MAPTGGVDVLPTSGVRDRLVGAARLVVGHVAKAAEHEGSVARVDDTHALALREVAFVVRDENSGLLAVCASHPASKVVDLLLVAVVDQEVEVRAACGLIAPEDGVREVACVECRLVGQLVDGRA